MRLRPRARNACKSGLRVAAALGLAATALAAGGTAGAGMSKPLSLHGRNVLTGKPLGLAAYDGKPVVVNLWSSSCGACFADARALASFEQMYRAAAVLGVDVADTTSGARSLYRRAGWRHPSIADPSGRIAAQLRLQTLPTTLFLDRKHRVVERINGQTSAAGFAAGYQKASA
jgi:thiol-disulfide isomerase/thioredoxin